MKNQIKVLLVAMMVLFFQNGFSQKKKTSDKLKAVSEKTEVSNTKKATVVVEAVSDKKSTASEKPASAKPIEAEKKPADNTKNVSATDKKLDCILSYYILFYHWNLHFDNYNHTIIEGNHDHNNFHCRTVIDCKLIQS